jgi:hypothetical protein
MLHLLNARATPQQVIEMLEVYEDMIKAEQRIEYESLINIRPRVGNRSIVIASEEIRRQVSAVTNTILGGVHEE